MEYNKNKNTAQIKRLIEIFEQFCISKDPNKKKGGLIAFASCAIGLGADCEPFINDLLSPVLNCLLDPDTRVRYFASESLYNIVKVARQNIIPQFPSIFSALSRLVADNDTSVKNASELLDRLLKDIITENSQIFDLQSFIPLLKERVYTKNSFARQFLISWIAVSFKVAIMLMSSAYQIDIFRSSMPCLKSACCNIFPRSLMAFFKCSKTRCLRFSECVNRFYSNF